MIRILLLASVACRPEPLAPVEIPEGLSPLAGPPVVVEPDPDPDPDPEVWSTWASFWPVFVEQGCVLADECGNTELWNALGCGGVSVAPECSDFRPLAARACLEAEWSCDGTDVPLICAGVCPQDQDTGVSVVEPDPTFVVTLVDGDGLPDDGFDADRVELSIEGGSGTYELGIAQTAIGDQNGWFGEDCYTGDVCHQASSTGVVLHRVGTVAEIVAGATTLIPVDYPVNTTPGLTYYVATVGRCWVFGHDPAYYSTLGCDLP
ncbi:MAG: hypothetical protein KC621_19335 [Myxococcales bacterium]|nr:hypothetical protein [Myxococcales bacterium]